MYINQINCNVQMPNVKRNYPIFNENRVNSFLNMRENALPYLSNILNYSKSEKQIMEALYILNKMLDNKVTGIDKMYPVLSKLNDTNSPNIQVLLSGIYRKTLIPDAYGPLNKMLIRQSLFPNSPYFDPTEEIGGAILEYNTKYNKN